MKVEVRRRKLNPEERLEAFIKMEVDAYEHLRSMHGCTEAEAIEVVLRDFAKMLGYRYD